MVMEPRGCGWSSRPLRDDHPAVAEATPASAGRTERLCDDWAKGAEHPRVGGEDR